jgi:hypothetical protein
MTRLANIFLMIIVISTSASAQMFQCPAGSRNVDVNGATMCQCPDGSFGGIYGCTALYAPPPPRPQGIPCGNGYCPFGTSCSMSGRSCMQPGEVDCGSHICGLGNKCTRQGGCVASNREECGDGYCYAGQMCTSANRCLKPETVYGKGTGVMLALMGHPVVSGLPKLAPGLKVSDSLKNEPVAPTPWFVIAAKDKMMAKSDAGSVPGSGVPLAPGFNPFTSRFDISSSQMSVGAPNFAAPSGPARDAIPNSCYVNPVTYTYSCETTFRRQ